ncbi:cytochrome P450 [Xylariaceae sp. AK1471]|nr:cytochrome P450 [Xylariaceae sp. AK1471]
MSFDGMATNSSSSNPLSGGKVDLSEWATLNYAISFALVVGSLIWASWSGALGKSKPMVPGVYVVGGSSRSEMKATAKRFRSESKTLIREGYNHTKGHEPFYVPSNLGPRLIIPTRYMEELKSAPMDKVDFVGTVHEVFEFDYTGVVHRSRTVPNTLISHLTPNLPKIMPEIQDELKVAINEEFPPCDDWTEVEIMPCMSRVITRATSRMAGGKALAHDPEWVTAAISYALTAFNASQKIKSLPWPVRRLVAPWLSEIRKDVPWCFSVAARVAIPILEHREQTGEEATDFLQFLKDNTKGAERENSFISHLLLMMAFASTHSSVLTIGALIYDLCAYPELVDIMREEYEGIVDKDGNIPRGGFNKMVKMDSIMKESQRISPITVLTFERIFTDDRTLRDGFTIPAGSQIGVPNFQIGMNPKFYSNPEKFDPLRFEKLRNDPDTANKTQFVSAHAQSMSFGYGRHACPGRQFMDQEFKAFLVKLLTNYDLKFKDGQTRQLNVPLDNQYVLQRVPIMLKRRDL